LIPVYYWFLFNLVTAYVIKVYVASNEAVKDQKNAYQDLSANLEKIVDERTANLQKQQTELQVLTIELEESRKRYHEFIHNSYEGVARFELKTALDLSIEKEKQASFILKNLFLAECNLSYAKIHGLESTKEAIGQGLDRFWEDSEGVVEKFIDSGYRFDNIQTSEKDNNGGSKWYMNFGKSTMVENHMHTLWVTQVDITHEVLSRKERDKLLTDLEEYAFITSHEIRRPISNLLGLSDIILEHGENLKELPKLVSNLNLSSKELDEVVKKMASTLSRTTYNKK
jgi:hypothetical protein